MEGVVEYARRDMRSDSGILRSFSCGRMMPSCVISEKSYKRLSKKEQKKWVVLRPEIARGYR